MSTIAKQQTGYEMLADMAQNLINEIQSMQGDVALDAIVQRLNSIVVNAHECDAQDKAEEMQAMGMWRPPTSRQTMMNGDVVEKEEGVSEFVKNHLLAIVGLWGAGYLSAVWWKSRK